MHLAQLPRVRLGHFPTSLEKHEISTKALEGSARLFAYQHLFSKQQGNAA